MKHYVYETTNLINSKKYRGVHSTTDDNKYLGSGKLICQAVDKYGEENFEVKILEFCETRKKLFEKEREYVDEEWIKRKDTYNLKVGGEGGWDYINLLGLCSTKEARQRISKSIKKAHQEGRCKSWPKKTRGFLGKTHTLEAREKISKNNGNALTKEVIDKRINDFNLIEKKRGYISKLALMWNVSHTQVRRLINQL